jgi:hypothetical protein
VNGDGNVDLLVPNSKPGLGTLTVFLGTGRGEFAPAPASPIQTGADVYFVAVGDLNGNGHPDAVLSNNHDDRAILLLGDGRGDFTPSSASPLHMGNRGWQMQILDYDGDSKMDLITVNETSVRAFRGDGRGGFEGQPLVVPSGGRGCWKLAMGDLNEDGIPDVVTPNVESMNVTILLSRRELPIRPRR